jgi:hypothetical protein
MQRRAIALGVLVASLLAVSLTVGAVSAGTAATVTGLDTKTAPYGGGDRKSVV